MASAQLAIIGGTGLYRMGGAGSDTVTVATPYGDTSGPITIVDIDGVPVAFVPRHGEQHQFAPHTLPYRANLWALKSLGVQSIISAAAVGSLVTDVAPGQLAVPDQVVDRTWGRDATYFDGGGIHVSFADPYCPAIRQALLAGDPDATDGGTMVVIPGPRFSTRAESQSYAASGWSLINMTGMPEAALARELKMCYATLALVTDLDAGIDPGDGVSAADVYRRFAENLPRMESVLRQAVSRVDTNCRCADGDHSLTELFDGKADR